MRWLIAVLLGVWVASSLALAQDQPIDDLDRLYLSFQSHKPSSGGPSAQPDGYFVAIKFWLLDRSGIPDPNRPTTLYASAYLSAPSGSGTQRLLRVSFNGTRLLESSESFGPYYQVKRPPDPREKWISWYAHLSERSFPTSLAYDNFMMRGPFDLDFPSAYKLVIPDRAVLVSQELSVSASPLDGTLPTPADATIVLFPSRLAGTLRTFPSYGENVAPDRPSITFPQNNHIVEGSGWTYGNHAGLAGFSACNEKVMGFDGGAGVKRYVFRACTVMVKPVEFVVERAR